MTYMPALALSDHLPPVPRDISSLPLQHCWILLERQEESINIACSPGASIRQSTRLFGAFGSLHKKKMSQKENVNFKEYRTVGNLHPRRAYDRRLKMQRSSGIVLWSPSKAFGVNYIRLHNHS